MEQRQLDTTFTVNIDTEQRAGCIDKENSSKISNSCNRPRGNLHSHYFDEMAKDQIHNKMETYSTERIEIVKVEIPSRDHFTSEKLTKIESIHDEHLKDVRNHFLSRINKLEKRLEKSHNILKQKDSILNKFRVELQMEVSPSPHSIVHRANLSKSSSNDSIDEAQIDLAYQFEKQIEEIRLKYSTEIESTKSQCNHELEQQKLRYEQYLEDIKSYYQQEREMLNQRIIRLQEEVESLKTSYGNSSDNSFCSESELGFVQLVEQISKVNKEHSDLKVRHTQDTMRFLKEQKDLELALREAREFGEKVSKKFDDLAIISKEEISKLNLKIKNLEKVKTEAEDKLKEISELKKQVTMLKLDMIKSESTEKKLKEAIQKKKEELQKEKKLRQDKQQNSKSLNKKNVENTNKLEKDLRLLMKENNDIKEENKILKNRVSEMLNKEQNQGGNRPSIGSTNLNSSVVIPLNNALNCSVLKNEAEQGKNKNSRSSIANSKIHGKTLDNRAPSLKCIPNLLEILNQEKHIKQSPKLSCKTLNKSSFLFGERKRSGSQDNIIGEYDSGSFKYCETCKYKIWRQRAKQYDAQDLLINRDLIRSIRCLACEKQYETKHFINHCKDCRLTHGVPFFLDEKCKASGKIDVISCDHFDNSLSSSPKNIFDESRYFSQNKEIEFSPDDIVSRSPDLAYENSKICTSKERKNSKVTDQKSSDTENDLNLQSQFKKTSQRYSARVSTVPLRRLVLNKIAECDTAPESLINSSRKVQINKKDFVDDKNHIVVPDSLSYNFKTSQESNKDSFLKRCKDSTSKSKCFKAIVKNRQIPTIKITNSVLQSNSSRQLADTYNKMMSKYASATCKDLHNV